MLSQKSKSNSDIVNKIGYTYTVKMLSSLFLQYCMYLKQ